ncbi:MAG: aminotransferase class III-fold pyridoxal phosphate-dependent enzyme, partial [Chloroflexota bacterium]
MNINIFDRYNDKELWQKDLDHVVHPWATYPAFDKEGAKFIAESQGGYVYDSSGNKYLDGVGGIWCVNIGYGREEMAQTMAEQAMRLPFYNAFTNISNPPLAELSAKLAELTPAKLNHSFLSTGGSVANDSAIRIVHHYFHRLGKPEKRKIISRKDAYHGSTYMAMSLTGTPSSRKDFHFANDIVEHVSAPNLYRRPEGMSPAAFCDHLIEELEAKILELGPENVAAFIAEPIMGSGGVLVPPDGYIKRAFEICKKYEMLYISDEVVTGFGRLGHWFASEPVYGIQPDIITSAKGLTSGYQPLGATIISDEIHEVMRSPEIGDNLFYHGFTYSGHPIACAVALTNIDIIERENILDHVQEVGPYFEQRLAT